MNRNSFMKLFLTVGFFLTSPFIIMAQSFGKKRIDKGIKVDAGRDRFDKPITLFEGDTFFTKVSAKDTDGDIFVFETAREKKGGPPLHYHFKQDEFWYILEGSFLFKVGDQTFTAKPGDSVFGPRMMTGRYPARNEVGLWEPLSLTDSIGLSPEIETLSSLIKNSGYETALFGKWHLGSRPENSPNLLGFDQFFGISPGAADYIDHKFFSDEPILYENNTLVDKEGYLTDLITDYSVDFIKKKHDKPFFINLEYNAPHWPWQRPGDEPYPYGKTWADFQAGGTPEVYAGMVQNLDKNIGRVLQAIKETGLDNSTIIIFTSDNGGEKFSDMGPLQGRKGNLYEGGIRVPAAVRWPGNIDAGTTSDQVVITMDWTVTMLELANATIPDDVTFDGISLLDHLEGKTSANPRKLFWRIGRQGADNLQNAYRDGDWKYLKTSDGEFLFDLKTDVGEGNNLKDMNPEIFDRLKRDFEKLNGQMLKRLSI